LGTLLRLPRWNSFLLRFNYLGNQQLHETIDVHETDEAAAWGEVERNDTAYYVYEEESGEWNTLFVETSLHMD
jgi:hypothetical protein